MNVISIRRAHVSDKLWEVVVGEFDFIEEYFPCDGFRVCDDGAVDVVIEEASIEEKKRMVCGDAELARFEDNVEVMRFTELKLRPVRFEVDNLTLFIFYFIKVSKPPFLITKKLKCFMLRRNHSLFFNMRSK